MKTFTFFDDIITEQKLPKQVTGLLVVQKPKELIYINSSHFTI